MGLEIFFDPRILYVTDNFAISPPTTLIKTLTALKCTEFVALIQTTGLTAFINGMKGVTIFAPTDAGFRTRASVINSLTVSQKRAYILSVVIPQIIYTDNIKSASYDTILAANNIEIKASM
jgi:uncharacterized surface protein with fasciclin (FAS1) repeats